ncbi:hypothetical protein LO762_31260 [Actinocorallia sp. API 0066]|uniref:hypothetical protein n=1 Tax=Actinocorallia sp. API 0066 TaxID=2896846 RepID=UPI001E3FD0B5|nr:hypothetical protein [Actinocorallia sp. API 0066]MCD0453630.1 hypothetical protein [Actinocorallia sp. API 0066]
MTWTSREDFPPGASARGLLLVSPDADVVAPLSAQDRAAALELTAATLKAAGVGAGDRVVVALNNDGELQGSSLAEAALSVAEAVASVGPRGRLRLHRALTRTQANVLVTTPSGAMDFLARLHLEFLLDPLDLELERILLVGEIPSRNWLRQLEDEFDAEVVQLFADPFFGVPVAYGPSLTPVREGLIGLAPPAKDELVADHAGPAEIVVTPRWHTTLGGARLRTGWFTAGGAAQPTHTAGEHLLVRGRWLSLPRVTDVLSRIDGISHWNLEVSREGTLDRAVLRVTFARDSLVRNPMWSGRVTQALVGVTPVTIEVAVAPEAAETAVAPAVTDLRGHHLGRDRSAL